MIRRLSAALLVTALAWPALALSQDGAASESDQMAQVVMWSVNPSQLQQWEAAITKFVEAAETADIGIEGSWHFYQMSPNRYALVFPVPDMAYFDDPMQWIRLFDGTPGETMVQEAIGMIQSVDHEVISDELIQGKGDWTYTPEGYQPSGDGFAHVDQMWVRPGQAQAFDAVVKEYTALLADLGYPYKVIGHEIQFGESDRVDFVILADNPASFYGENDLMAMVQAAGHGERMQALFGKLTPTISDWEHFDAMYRADLSYWPVDQVASN